MSRKMPVALVGLGVAVISIVLALGPSSAVSGEEETGEYKGSKACKTCHKEAHTAWEEMKHSKAFDALKPDQVTSGKDEQGRACVQCHTTGYLQGGFESVEKTPELVNVGCEACHGPASRHVKVMLAAMMNGDEEVSEKHIARSVDCTRCHNPHISYKKLYGGE